MAAFIITFRLSTKTKQNGTYNERRQALINFLENGTKEAIYLYPNQKTTSTLFFKRKTSLKKLAKDIIDYKILSDKDKVMFFKIFDESKDRRFSIVGRIVKNKYSEDDDITKFIVTPIS